MKTLLCWYAVYQEQRTSWDSDWPPSTNPHNGGVGRSKVGLYAGDQLLLLQVLVRCIWQAAALSAQPLRKKKNRITENK